MSSEKTYNLLRTYIDSFDDYHRKMEKLKEDFTFFNLYIKRNQKSHREWELLPKKLWFVPNLVSTRLSWNKSFDQLYEDLFMIEYVMERNQFDQDELEVLSNHIFKICYIKTSVIQVDHDRFSLRIEEDN